MTCTIVPLAIGFWSSLLVYLPVSCKGSSQEVINIHLRMDQNSGRRLGCEAKAGEEVGVHLYYRKDPSQEWIEYTYKYSSWPSNDSRNENCKDEDPDFCIYRTTDGGKGYVGKGYIRLWKFNPEKHSGYYNCVTLVANRDNVRSRSFVWKVSLADPEKLKTKIHDAVRTYTYTLSDRDWYQNIRGKHWSLLATRIRCGASTYVLDVEDKDLRWYYRDGDLPRIIDSDFRHKEPFQMRDVVSRRVDVVWQDLYVPAASANGTTWSGVYVCVARGVEDSDRETMEIRRVKVDFSS